MIKKYNTSLTTTNDLYFAAFLLSHGCELYQVKTNGRRRISFVFVARSAVATLKKSYKSGEAVVKIHTFRDSLKQIRRLMDETQRSTKCPTNPKNVYHP